MTRPVKWVWLQDWRKKNIKRLTKNSHRFTFLGCCLKSRIKKISAATYAVAAKPQQHMWRRIIINQHF
jgi:hypothetical protein